MLPDGALAFVTVAIGAAVAAAQAWYFPFGSESAEPRGRRTLFAVASILVILGFIEAAHLILPGHATLAAMVGAMAGVQAMKPFRRAVVGDAPPLR